MFSGGTVDITVHEVLDDGNVRELYKANGGPWGGKSVNDAFLHFLGGLFVCSGCIVELTCRNNIIKILLLSK